MLFQMEKLMGLESKLSGSRACLDMGMFWNNSGPVSVFFPRDGWKGWVFLRFIWSLS